MTQIAMDMFKRLSMNILSLGHCKDQSLKLTREHNKKNPTTKNKVERFFV